MPSGICMTSQWPATPVIDSAMTYLGAPCYIGRRWSRAVGCGLEREAISAAHLSTRRANGLLPPSARHGDVARSPTLMRRNGVLAVPGSAHMGL